MRPAPSMDRRPPIRATALVALLLSLSLLLWRGSSSAAAETSTKQVFSGFEAAWQAASAKKVTALMDAKGKLRVSLLTPKAGGTWTPDQARRALATYFGDRGVSGPKLKHVVPKQKRKLKKTDNTVRVYDYTYRPYGGDRRSTRLTVTVKKDASKQWVLASVTESPKR